MALEKAFKKPENLIKTDENQVITSLDELFHIEPTKHEIVLKWFAETNNKVPAIVDNKGRIYCVPKDERNQHEANYLPKLSEAVAKAFEISTPEIIFVTRNVLESQITRQTGNRSSESLSRGISKITTLIRRAIDEKATDLHLKIDGPDAFIKHRIYGALNIVETFDKEQGESILNAVFESGQYVKGETDGSPAKRGFFYHHYLNENWLCRVSEGESDLTTTKSMIIRFRNMTDLPLLGQLGYDMSQMKDLMMGKFNRGFTLFMGKTNSGKSTSMTAFMKEIPENQHNLEVSAETEVKLPHFTHLVLPRSGKDSQITIWRRKMCELPMQHDVDFLALNEINTKETAGMASSIMMQGTSGVSTIHGSGWGDAINRLTNPEDFSIPETILFSDSFFNMLVYQSLAGTLCQNCSLKEHPEGHWNALLKEWFGPLVEKFCFLNRKGCEECNGLGVTGQTLVSEVIPITQDNRHLLKSPDNSQPMRNWLKKTGRLTIHQHAFKKALYGTIDPVEIQKVIGRFSKHNLFDLISTGKPEDKTEGFDDY